MLSAVRLFLRTNYCNGPSKLSPASSINRVLGRNGSISSDPYTKIAEQPKDVVESLAETLELRAAEEQQTLLRERWVRSESWEISWEKGGFDQNPEKCLDWWAQALTTRVLAGTTGRVLEVGIVRWFQLSHFFKVGSGTGAVCRHLAKLPGIQSVLGVDPSPLLVEKAEALGGGPEYLVGCGTKLPLGKVAQFSTRTATSFSGELWHSCALDDIVARAKGRSGQRVVGGEDCLRCSLTNSQILRVLRPGGQLLVFDNDMEGWSMANGKFDVFKVSQTLSLLSLYI